MEAPGVIGLEVVEVGAAKFMPASQRDVALEREVEVLELLGAEVVAGGTLDLQEMLAKAGGRGWRQRVTRGNS